MVPLMADRQESADPNPVAVCLLALNSLGPPPTLLSSLYIESNDPPGALRLRWALLFLAE